MDWFAEMCADMEARHGERGWKRRLAEMLGVSDSNVQNWIRAGSAPPIVRTAFEAKQKARALEGELKARGRDSFVIEELENDRRFRVLALDSQSGRFIEVATTRDLPLAQAIVEVESGALDEKIGAVAFGADILFDHHEDRQALNDLRNWR